MSIISGNVFYTPNNTLVPNMGIANVPVVLRDTSLFVGAVALTDATGAFVFNNVPNGNYQVIEAWGTLGGVASPVNYLTATIPMLVMPTEAEPPLSALPVLPPALADKLMAVSPNLLNINVTSNVVGLAFYDAPVGSKPLIFNGLQTVGGNLITAADNGSFGSLPAGSPVNSIPAVAPYPTVTPGLPYQALPEIADGHYSIVNIRRRVNTGFNWWNLADHETMLETGRFMFVNGDQPGSILFTDTIAVTPNTLYIFTGWGGNLLNSEGTPPRFSVKVIGSDGQVLGYELLNSIASTPIPVWYQAGFLFNSEIYSSITVEVVSEAVFSPVGNDYFIDELRLFEAKIIDLLEVKKSFAPATIYAAFSGVGKIATINTTVTNTSAISAPNVFYQDIINPQLQFVPGSVLVNGSNVGFETADPNIGFSLGNMAGGDVKTISFKVTSLVSGPITIPNKATATYDAATNGNGDVIKNTIDSNVANLEIVLNQADIIVSKSTDKAFANTGDIITYTLILTNIGNMPANNVIITDAVPSGTSFIGGSVTGAVGNLPNLTMLNPILSGGSAVVTFQVLVGNTIPNPNPVVNNATVAYTFTIDPAIPNGGSGVASSNAVDTLVNSAIISTTKEVDKAFANVGDIITYTITVNNTGNVAANNVVLTDALAPGTSFVVGSLTGATGAPPTLTLAAPVMAGGSSVVTYKVLVSTTVPNPNPVQNSVIANFVYTVDPSKPNGVAKTSYSNVVETQINTAKLSMTKTVDKSIAYLGDTISYNIVVKNTGNTTANNVVITDVVPSGTVIVPGSLLVSAPYTPAPGGVMLLTNPILANQTVLISFKVLVTNIPTPNPIVNQAKSIFTYTVDPANPNGVIGTSTSNAVTTLVFRNNFGQQISDLIESVALEQAALAAIANAEGAKIQKMVTMQDITTEKLLCLNKSVSEMMSSISMFEAVLKQKLAVVDCQINADVCQ